MKTVSLVLTTESTHLIVIVNMICGAITGSVKIVLINVMVVKDLQITVSLVNQTELILQLVIVLPDSLMMDLIQPVQNVTVNVIPVPDLLIPV
jgi:hypothetical protein